MTAQRNAQLEADEIQVSTEGHLGYTPASRAAGLNPVDALPNEQRDSGGFYPMARWLVSG